MRTALAHCAVWSLVTDSLQRITDDLNRDLAPLQFGAPVTHVYNPLIYARPAWDAYCRRYGQGERRVLFVGMNPGPFGMAQVGVPFGEVSLVRDWLGIEAAIGQPTPMHPKRPIHGFACARSEVSGQRFWSWARARYHTPERFFSQCFVTNYCPLCFMDASGANRTPDKLTPAERTALFAACDRALRRTVELMHPEFAIGIGQFAEKRLEIALAGMPGVRIARAPHPSPASPAANAGWPQLMDAALHEAGVIVPRD